METLLETLLRERCRAAALHVVLVFCAVASAQNTVGTGVVRGEVVRSDGTPGEFLQVCIAGTGLCSASDQNGRFAAIDARPGLVQLEVRIESGGILLSGTVQVRAGQTSEVRSEEFVESRDAVSTTPLVVRGGVLASLARRIVLRAGYSHVIGYFDTAASRSLEVGIGYRFWQFFAAELG